MLNMYGMHQVKVPIWVDGNEIIEFVGIGARFGPTLESKEKRATQTKVALADPPDCCSTPRNQVITSPVTELLMCVKFSFMGQMKL